MRSVGDFLSKLTHVKASGKNHWQADCPCPNHSTPQNHLSVTLESDKILVKCFGEHTSEDIVTALGLNMEDLFISEKLVEVPAKIVATYDYQDEKKNLLFQVVRYEPKNFSQRHKNGKGEWVWNLDGARRVLYHLPELVTCTDETVYLVEGEKDTDNLWDNGLVATTSPGGANSWRPEYADFLKGLKVVVIPDKDPAGYAYAKAVIKSLEGKAREIKVIILPGEAKDSSDWLAEGNDASQLATMEQDISALFEQEKVKYEQGEDCITWEKPVGFQKIIFKAEKLSEERTGIHARIGVSLGEMSLSWSYLNIERREERSSLAGAAYSVLKGDITKTYGKEDLRLDLDNFCAGLWSFHVSIFEPEDMAGDDSDEPLKFLLKPYIIEEGGTMLFAPPGRGKSYTGLLWATAVNAGCSKFWPVMQCPTLFINLERSRKSLAKRLGKVNKVLGLPSTHHLHIINARGKSLNEVIPACRKYVKKYGIKLVILDSISRTGMGDLNENQPGNKIIDNLSALCPSWVALSHTSKANEERMYGTIMLEAGADICVMLASQIKEDGTLGIGWEITKQNDIGRMPQEILAFEFTPDYGLLTVRKAKSFEFPDIEGKHRPEMLTAIIDYISNQDSGDATATQVEDALGYKRNSITQTFLKSGRFMMTRREKQSVYYGVKQ